MKKLTILFAIMLLVLPVSVFAEIETLGPPQCTQDEAWESVLDNAYQIAENYAIANNPRSTFMTSVKDYHFTKQVSGDFQGKYLLEITTAHGKDYSVAVLEPLFDVNQPSELLNIEKPLWRLLSAELNGKSY